jgi:hypothetical protein
VEIGPRFATTTKGLDRPGKCWHDSFVSLRYLGWVVAVVLVVASGPAWSEPTESGIDVLVEALRDQGLIDQQTADEVLAAGDENALRELVKALQEQGVLNEERATEVLAADAKDREERPLIERFEAWGDFRNRFKGVWFDKDPTGNERNTRTRGQLRFRLRGKAEANEYFDMQVGVTTVNNNNSARRKNVDWGKPANGAPEEVRFDQLFATIHPLGRDELPYGLGRVDMTLGKFAPPFRSNVGKDLAIWDDTLSLDGVALDWVYEPTPNLEIATQGSFFQMEVALEPPNPRLFALQVVPRWQALDWLQLSFAPTLYAYQQIDNERDQFREDGVDFGNLPDGLSDDDTATITDFRAWARITAIEDWPVEIYGRYIHNFSAAAQPDHDAGKEDDGFSAGVIIGDRNTWFEIGGGFIRVEANAVPAQFHAFEPFDGHTNRDVWMVHLSRAINEYMVIDVEWFHREATDRGIDFKNSVKDSDSTRLNAGLTLLF